MIIVVGNGPDLLMRQGLVEVFHGSAVRVVDSEGAEKFHESASDRSLWVVAKGVAGYLRANGLGIAEITGMVFVGLRTEIARSGRTIELSMKLPDELTSEWRVHLVSHFANYIRQITENSIRP
jgi:hypothetical protein